jgi:hypothetical protein
MGKQQEVSRPKRRSDWTLVYADRASEKGWRDLCAVQPGPCRTLYDRLEHDPTIVENPDKQHQLKGSLSSVIVAGSTLTQWQYELANGARVWYAIDVDRRVVHFTRCATTHPNETK